MLIGNVMLLAAALPSFIFSNSAGFVLLEVPM